MLGENLKILREKVKMTQNDVAEKLSISPQSVSKWERNEAYPTAEHLPKLASLYKCTTDEIFGINKKAVVSKINSANVDISNDKFFSEINKGFNAYKRKEKYVLPAKFVSEKAFIEKVADFAKEIDVISIAGLQRKFLIGFARAGNIVDRFEKLGVITNDFPKKVKTIEMVEFINYLKTI